MPEPVEFCIQSSASDLLQLVARSEGASHVLSIEREPHPAGGWSGMAVHAPDPGECSTYSTPGEVRSTIEAMADVVEYQNIVDVRHPAYGEGAENVPVSDQILRLRRKHARKEPEEGE